MSYKQQIFEWSVPIDEVSISTNIGYEVEFSLKSFFSPILYRITSFEEVKGSVGIFSYSLDSGDTWISFPKTGQAFTTAYKMRLIINPADVGFVFAEKYGTIYKIRADIFEVIDTYSIDRFNSSGFEINPTTNNLYISGQNQTIYRMDGNDDLEIADNSINAGYDPLGIAIDGTRQLLWQVQSDVVFLKDIKGNFIKSYALPSTIYNSSLIKVVNKFNGNFVFIGLTASGDMIIECNRSTGVLTYVLSSKSITDISLYDDNSYLVCFGDEWIGLYDEGSYDTYYIQTDFDSIDQVIQSSEAEFYALSRSENKLAKFTSLLPMSSSSSSSSLDSSSSSSSN